jgi:hypothetical protein
VPIVIGTVAKIQQKIWKKDLTDGAFYSIIVPVE